ncbi:DEAD/DEAH box helicase family protein [Flavivirga amylovorans]|uniref:DEAD/DEAH box helicase family protein n=1 Tax=Flavivirga amylovorans TaxID=870486 RepID=A0ABT8WZ26_9FLAO|nr:DEAD/DEAH box helicase [Flavivirga amylovorans]MDO5986892.1 DEAD/DEAH box helicase family protein [Flavivirga amylovorans]
MNKEINLIKTLFKGREDVFAIHWQKGNKSGYMPAYHYDPYRYRLHKMKGGTFKNYNDKTYLLLTDQQITKHLNGEQLVGIYPLLKDNTSWFIASDFDKQNWEEDSRSFINACSSKGIPAYLERSKSGNGGHVWIFFDQPYPAIRSRKILISILEEIGVFSAFDKSSSFDRLFPNQNFLSGKGLGNLIALPFYKTAWEQGNSCFVNENLNPIENQWNFLSSILRVKTTHLDEIFESLIVNDLPSSDTRRIHSTKLHITLNNSIRLNRSGITSELINFLKDELNFSNPEYFIKKKTNKSTWSTERYFKFIEETENEIIIPRGFIGKLIRYCKQQKIDFKFLDERKKLQTVLFSPNLTLRPHQNKAIEIVTKKDLGVITAPPGSGKTVIGLKIIAEKQQPALIVVHRKQLLEQWIERIQAFLEIPKNEIGKIGQGKAKVGKHITVAMIQSLGKQLEKQEIKNLNKLFGTVIIDECHHIPAETFRKTISKLSPYYQYGLTATPFRKGSDGKQIFIHLGKIIADIKPEEIKNYKRARINIQETTLDIPFNSKTDTFETLSKMLVHDSTRNKFILHDVHKELNSGKKVILITERKEHIDTLYQFLKQSFETIILSGEDSESNQKAKWKILNEGNYQALITTGQFFGEGTDLQNASCLFLVYPFSFKGKLIQYIGRVQRSEITPIIYDYHDRKIDYLNKLFLKRNTYYRHLDRQASLFDEQDHIEEVSKNIVTIDKQIKISIDQLDFRYGAIAFKYKESKLPIELEFEIENDEIRPEFDVLKPYFAKFLKSKNVRANIFAEISDGKLVSQIATSTDLEMINREIIESVKFRFTQKEILGKKYPEKKDENLLDLDQLQERNGVELYKSEDELLNSLLQNENVRHFRQLRYLAMNHDSNTLKLRFVLNPFSFVFLLTGIEQYHIVLETLDTEEATYIWHINKNVLSQKLQAIDLDLNNIRNNGRQIFLQNQPENFSRLIHDYSDERKGFIIWKDLLEERLL